MSCACAMGKVPTASAATVTAEHVARRELKPQSSRDPSEMHASIVLIPASLQYRAEVQIPAARPQMPSASAITPAWRATLQPRSSTRSSFLFSLSFNPARHGAPEDAIRPHGRDQYPGGGGTGMYTTPVLAYARRIPGRPALVVRHAAHRDRRDVAGWSHGCGCGRGRRGGRPARGDNGAGYDSPGHESGGGIATVPAVGATPAPAIVGAGGAGHRLRSRGLAGGLGGLGARLHLLSR